MEKVKAIGYTVFIKHLFWTLSVVVILMGLAGWFMSSGKLKGDYDKNHDQVTQTKGTIDTINNKSEGQIFNQTSHDGMKAMNAQRRLDVYSTWNDKYAKQRSEVLVWPQGPGELSKKFVSFIEDKLKGRPIEELEVLTDGTDHLPFRLREEYRNVIKELLPKLAQMINAQWNPQGTGGGSSFGGRGEGGFGGGGIGGGGFGSRPPVPTTPGAEIKPANEYVVYWDPGDQGAIQSTHFGFADAEELPTTPEILYSMEDYWVLKALMQIIARTNTDEENGPALLPHQAAIREINSIRIGASAENNLGKIYAVAPAAGAAAEGVPPGVPPGTPPGATSVPPAMTSSGEGMMSVEGAPGTTPAGPDPIAGRYVDNKSYLPLAAEEVRSAATSGTPEKAYLAVAKRMPVRMQVKMDQRKLNKFLIECGNADLMLEVKQVRINPNAPDIFGLSGSSGRAAAGGNFGGGSAFGGGRRVGEGRFGGEGVQVGSDSKYPWDVDVEVYGIIYIFNPPSLKRLEDKLEPEEIAKFRASIKQAAPAVDAAGDAPSETPPPAGEEKPAAKPPMPTDAAKTDAALAPAG